MTRHVSIRDLIAEQLREGDKTAAELAEILKLPVRAVVTKASHMVRDGEATIKGVPAKYVYNKAFETVMQRQARLKQEKAAKRLEQDKLKPVIGTYRASLHDTYVPPKELPRRTQ